MNEKLAKSTRSSTRIALNNYGGIFWVSRISKGRNYYPRLGATYSYFSSNTNINQNDNGLMEKKVTKKFYLLSTINVVTSILLAKGNWLDALALIFVLGILVMNHTTLLKMVNEVSRSMAGTDGDSMRSVRKIFLLMGLKMTLLAVAVLMIYFYNKELTPKVLLLMIFQLIIQVVSIKNNY